MVITVSFAFTVGSQAGALKLQQNNQVQPETILRRMGRHGLRSLQKARAEDHTQFQVIGPRGESITMTLHNVSSIKLFGNDLLCRSVPLSALITEASTRSR